MYNLIGAYIMMFRTIPWVWILLLLLPIGLALGHLVYELITFGR